MDTNNNDLNNQPMEQPVMSTEVPNENPVAEVPSFNEEVAPVTENVTQVENQAVSQNDYVQPLEQPVIANVPEVEQNTSIPEVQPVQTYEQTMMQQSEMNVQPSMDQMQMNQYGGQPMMNQQPMQQPMMNQQPMQQPMMNQQVQQPMMQQPNYQMYNGVQGYPNQQMPVAPVQPKKKNGILKFLGIALGIFVLLIVVVAIWGDSDTPAPNTDVNVQNGFDKIYTSSDGSVKYIDGSYFEGVVVTNTQSALSAFDKVKDAMKFDKGSSEFKLYKTTTNGGLTYYKFQQVSNNRKIERYMTLVVDSNGKVKELIGNYKSNASPTASKFLSEEEITNLFKKIYGDDAEISNIEESVAEDGTTSIVTAIVIYDEYIIQSTINEESGEVISEVSLIESVVPSGITYANSSLSYTDRDGKESTISVDKGSKDGETYVKYFDSKRNITLGDGTGVTYNNFNSRIYDLYANKEKSYAIREGDNELLFNQTMKTYEEIYDFYLNNYGWKSYDNKGSIIAVFPNTSVNSNAFWVGSIYNMMFIGYGRKESESLVYGTDILTHEFTHGVVNYTAEFSGSCGVDGKLPNDPGALNEAFADIIGMAFDDEDWTMGEDANFEIRDTANPNKYSNPTSTSDKYYFPNLNGRTVDEYLSKYNKRTLCDEVFDNGGVHNNATVVTYSAYLMYSNNVFENKVEMGRVWFNALHRLNSNSRFEDAAIAVIAAAKDLDYSKEKLDIIYSTFKQVGML